MLFTTLQINGNNVGFLIEVFLLPRLNALAPPICTSCSHTELWKYLILDGKLAHKLFKWFWHMLLDIFSLKLAGSNTVKYGLNCTECVADMMTEV